VRSPAGRRRSKKRDLVVEVFLRQEAHLAADELVALVRRDAPRISRATVYRTLQWLEEAGVARRIEVGDGRYRFEHSHRHPRHFHLICKSCDRSFEFLSADIETLLDEIASARGFAARQSVLQIYGTCEACRTGRPQTDSAVPTAALFARDALRVAIATVRSGRDFYSRAARVARDTRVRSLCRRLAEDEGVHLGRLERRYRDLVALHPPLEAEPTMLFFERAAHGLFAPGAEELQTAAGDAEILRVSMRCERGASRFFRQYGQRFEASEEQRLFFDLAQAEQSHLERLVRERRALTARQRRPTSARRRRPA